MFEGRAQGQVVSSFPSRRLTIHQTQLPTLQRGLTTPRRASSECGFVPEEQAGRLLALCSPAQQANQHRPPAPNQGNSQ